MLPLKCRWSYQQSSWQDISCIKKHACAPLNIKRLRSSRRIPPASISLFSLPSCLISSLLLLLSFRSERSTWCTRVNKFISYVLLFARVKRFVVDFVLGVRVEIRTEQRRKVARSKFPTILEIHVFFKLVFIAASWKLNVSML